MNLSSPINATIADPSTIVTINDDDTPANTGAPSAPLQVGAIESDSQVTVSWSAPGSTGGNPIGGYTAISTPGNRTCTTTGSLYCTVTGLTDGTHYNFTVTAHNPLGTGPGSAPSNIATPCAVAGTGTMTTPTAAVSVGATGRAIVFTYTPACDMVNGAVNITVPSGWSPPSTNPNDAGYSIPNTGSLLVSGSVITVTGVSRNAGQTLTIVYGSKAGGGPALLLPRRLGVRLGRPGSAQPAAGRRRASPALR